MSEELKRKAQNLDTMTTEELEELLRLDAEAPEGQETDVETLLQIMEALAQRKPPVETNAQESWDAFQQRYLPNGQDDTAQQDKPLRLRSRRWLLLAAVIALLACIPFGAGALHREHPQDALATWKDGVFHFVGTSTTQTAPPHTTLPQITIPEDRTPLPYDSLQEALDSTGATANVVPTWIPEGFVLKDIIVNQMPQRMIYMAIYKKGDAVLNISLRSFCPDNPTHYEINDQLLELYQTDGTDYYIFYNNNQLVAIWLKDSYECSISGDFTLTELKKMIDSIKKS